MAPQLVNDFKTTPNRYKVHDLKLSKTIAMQTGPQVRLIEQRKLLVDKIQTSISQSRSGRTRSSSPRPAESGKVQRAVSPTPRTSSGEKRRLLKENRAASLGKPSASSYQSLKQVTQTADHDE